MSANLLPRLEFLAQALVRRQATCPHCGSTSLRTLGRKYVLVRIRKCEECGLAFTDPIYESRLGALYDRLYTGAGSTTALPDDDRLEELKRSVFAGTDKDYRDRVRRLRDLAPGPRLLEIGSSWGYFLFQARAGGFDPTGLEIGSRRAAFGRRSFDVRIAEDWPALDGLRFHVVYTSHVLEHFTDLSDVFGRLFTLLEPGGILAVEVPLFDFEERGDAVSSLIGAVHPLGFESGFFRRNLPRYGFRLRGFYDRWEDVPDRAVERCSGDNVICLAEKPGA